MDDTPIGQLAVEVGFLTPEELEECVAYQRSLPDHRALGRILLERGKLGELQLSFLLSVKRRNIKELEDYTRHKSDDLALADLLRNQQKLPREILLECLRRQAAVEREGGHIRLAALLFERQVADREGLQEFLDRQGWDMVVCAGCGALVKPVGPRALQVCDECGVPVQGAPASKSRGADGQNTRTASVTLPPVADDRTIMASKPGKAAPGPPRPSARQTPRNSKSRSVSGRDVVVPEQEGMPFGNYELLEEINRGGMGIVYRARQRGLRRIVALKVLLSDERVSDIDLQRFEREARAAASLHHPNIVSVIDVGEADGRQFLTMEYVSGPSLSRLLAGERPSVRRAVELLKPVCDGIEFAHRRGIVHRDLKPGNILLTPDGTPKVTDFGLAKEIGAESNLTKTGTALGTPAYMSPEQADGALSAVDHRSDVYGLGAVLYHLLTGAPPFQGETTVQTIYKVISHSPIAPRRIVPSIPEPVETICLKAMEKDPAKRYPSAGAMADDLDRWLRGEPILARPPSVLETVARKVRKHRTLVGMGGVTCAVVVASALVQWDTYRDAVARDKTDRVKAEEQALAERQRKEDEHRRMERDVLSLFGWQGDAGGLSGVAPAPSGEGVEGGPDPVDTQLARAYRALQAKASTDAREALDRARELASKNPAVRARVDLLSGLYHLAMGQYQKALDDSSAVLSADAANLYALVNRGIARRGLAELGPAAEDFTQALAAKPTDLGLRFHALFNRALVRMSQGDNAAALADLDTIGQIPELDEKSRASACLFHGLCAMEGGDFQQAIRDNTAVLEKDSKSLQALTNRGVCYVQLYQFDKALLDLTTAAAFVQPDDTTILVKIYTFRALSYYGLGRYPLAIEDNSRVLRLDSKSVQALTNRGLAYLGNNDEKNAVQDLERAVALAPDDRYALPALREARRVRAERRAKTGGVPSEK